MKTYLPGEISVLVKPFDSNVWKVFSVIIIGSIIRFVYSHSRDEDRLIEDTLKKRGYSKVREAHYVGVESLIYEK